MGNLRSSFIRRQEPAALQHGRCFNAYGSAQGDPEIADPQSEVKLPSLTADLVVPGMLSLKLCAPAVIGDWRELCVSGLMRRLAYTV